MDLEELMNNIRAERISKRNFPLETDNKNDNKSDNKSDNKNESYDIEKKLKELKKNEPSSDNIFRRLAIIGYEYGFVQRHLTYAEIFNQDEKEKKVHLASAKLELADLITQINILCITMKWDLEELRRLGAQHLEERHEDFKRKNWRN